MKYYIVRTKCGHVGKTKYIVIDFPVAAENGKEAAKKARRIPRVKHHQKDAIIHVTEVSYDEYVECFKKNDNDAYLKCSNKQEQNSIPNFCERILCNSVKQVREKVVDNRWVHKVLVRNYKKYMLNYWGVLCKLGKKHRDKVVNRQLIRATGNPRLIQLHDYLMNKPYAED